MTKPVRKRRAHPKVVKRGVFAHHRHTARLLPKRHTSFPLVALLLLMVGVLLVFSTTRAAADPPNDIVVTAHATGPIPSTGAVILSPKDGAQFTGLPITVSGTCEVGQGFYVRLFRNDIFSGSAPCSSGGTFAISTDLFDGSNKLTVQEANAADQTSPMSPVVTVFYYPNGLPGSPSGSGGSGSSGGTRFYISPEHDYQAGFTGQSVTEKLTFVGGTKPYRLTLNWGDGYSDTIDHITTGSVTLRHVYGTAANVRTYYTVTVHGSEAGGRTAGLQLFTVMNDPTIAGLLRKPPFIAGGIYHNPLLHGLLFAWPAYLLLLLMALCFWLGERRGENIILITIRRRGTVRPA